MRKKTPVSGEAGRAEKIYDALKVLYPRAETALNFSNSWQMLASTILSAQCTDERVNRVTGPLFSKHPEAEDYANMDQRYLEKQIKSCGFYRNKAKNIIGAAGLITEKYGGEVPRTMEDMLKLPGVARKTANVVLGNAFGVVEGIAVDTHVKRLSGRLGLTEEKDPVKIEKDLMSIFPEDKWFNLTYLLIEHGRAVCKAPAPFCLKCRIRDLCPRKGVKKSR